MLKTDSSNWFCVTKLAALTAWVFTAGAWAETPIVETRPQPVVLSELERSLADGNTGEEFTTKTLRWLSESKAVDVECAGDPAAFASPTVQRVFHAAHLTGSPTRPLAFIFDSMDTKLRPEQRLRIFDLHRMDAPCIRGVANAWWDHLVATQGPVLIHDFQLHLQYVGDHRKRFTFNGLIESHIFTDPEGDLTSRLYFLQEALLHYTSQDFYTHLAAAFLGWAVADTNTPDPDSRLEPIDILSTFVSNHHFAPLKRGTTFDNVSRNALARTSIQHRLAHETFAPAVMLAKSDDAKTRADGQETHYVYCAGDKITLGNPQGPQRANGPLADFLTLSADELSALRKDGRAEIFACGGLQASITNPLEPLRIPLRDPAAARFTVGEDRKIKAVSTFQIINEAGNGFVAKLKLGAIVKGYTTVEETTAADIRTEFFREMLDADFYFPANHGTNGTSIAIGDDGCRKLRIQRRMEGGVISEVVLFIPNNGEQKAVMDTELARLFQQRRALPVQRRLHIMDLKCNSIHSVPHWMRFYKLSLEQNINQAEARLKAMEYDGEVPVAIGAGRSFDAGNFSSILEHSNYPFKALELAAAEQPVSELIRYLQEAAFAPNASNGEPVYFDTKTQTQGINLVVTLTDGRRVTQ